MTKEELIVKLCKLHNYKNYYDLGAYPNRDTINLFNQLIKINVNIYAFDPASNPYNLLVSKFGNKINSFNIGVSNKNEKLTLYNVPVKDGGSSFDKNFLLGRDDDSIKYPTDNRSRIYKSEVQTVVLYDFIKQNNLPLPDLIKMDVENWEDKILSTFDFSKHCPILIISFHSMNTINYMKKHTKKYYTYERQYFMGKYNNERKYFYLTPKT